MGKVPCTLSLLGNSIKFLIIELLGLKCKVTKFDICLDDTERGNHKKYHAPHDAAQRVMITRRLAMVTRAHELRASRSETEPITARLAAKPFENAAEKEATSAIHKTCGMSNEAVRGARS